MGGKGSGVISERGVTVARHILHKNSIILLEHGLYEIDIAARQAMAK